MQFLHILSGIPVFFTASSLSVTSGLRSAVSMNTGPPLSPAKVVKSAR